MTTFFLLPFSVTCYMFTLVNSAYTAEDATALRSSLLSNYSSKVRPSDTTVVDVTFGMMHITELNIVHQKLHIVGFLVVNWNDSRLAWTLSDHGNMDSAYMLLSDIWSPPLLLNNAADEIKIMNDDTDLSSVNVYVHYTGYVVWLAPANFVAQCTINIMYYPFDSQKCDFVVSSWIFVTSHLQLSGSDSSINTDLYEENGEWDVTKSTVQNVTRTLLGHTLPAVKFTTHLTRKYSYYLMNMILPVVLLAVMAPFVFMLPVESGEKIGYALTILLSLSVVMTLVSDSIPPTSTNICVLSVYLLTTYIICSLETVVTVVTCRIHDFHLKGLRMSPKMLSFARILARITNTKKRIKDNSEESTTQNTISSSMSELEINKTNPSPKDIIKSKAWAESDDDVKEMNVVKEYTLEEFVFFFDKFNFLAFTSLTVIVTVVFMLVLRLGDA